MDISVIEFLVGSWSELKNFFSTVTLVLTALNSLCVTYVFMFRCHEAVNWSYHFTYGRANDQNSTLIVIPWATRFPDLTEMLGELFCDT